MDMVNKELYPQKIIKSVKISKPSLVSYLATIKKNDFYRIQFLKKNPHKNPTLS